MDSALNKNQPELGIFILPVLLKVPSDGDSLLDEEVQILWDFRSKGLGLQDSKNLVAGHKPGLGHTM